MHRLIYVSSAVVTLCFLDIGWSFYGNSAQLRMSQPPALSEVSPAQIIWSYCTSNIKQSKNYQGAKKF